MDADERARLRHVKTWPVIRHARWAYASWCFWRWWDAIGRRLGAIPNPSDMQYLEDIRNGRR